MAEPEDPVLPGHHAVAGLLTAPPLQPPWERRALCSSSSCSSAARSQSRLHNFSFSSLSWGGQRLLRCFKTEPRGVCPSANRGSTAEGGHIGRQGGEGDVEEGQNERSEEFRDAVVVEFQKAVDGIPLPQASGSWREETKGGLEPSPSPARERAPRPLNLRLRNDDACGAPSAAPENGVWNATNEGESLVAPDKFSAAARCSGRLRRWEVVLAKEKRPRFSPVMSKEEIEEDFFVMTGSKPPRRPRKRPRNVQKQIEVLCPGFYLTEIMPDLYRTS